MLAQHIAHLFVRDSVILFEEKLNLDDTKDTDHFEVGESSIRDRLVRLPVEYQFNQLAIHAIQTTSCEQQHRLASGVPTH